MNTRQALGGMKLYRSAAVPAVVLSMAGVAFAQPPPGPRRPPLPVNDPAPDSPIDRPRGPRFQKPAVEEVKAPAPPLPPREAKQGWVGWSFGTGYGWHGESQLETRTISTVDAGFAPTTLGHFGLDVGVQWNQNWALSLQTRHQVIPRKTFDQTAPPSSNAWAHSIFARAVYVFPRDGLHFFVGGMAGGGQGFRFRIDPQPSLGLGNSDTVRGGPLAFGPVGGFIWPLFERLSLVGEARVLVGAPDAASAAEFNVGAQFDLFRL